MSIDHFKIIVNLPNLITHLTINALMIIKMKYSNHQIQQFH
jgi:hypothetical protein